MRALENLEDLVNFRVAREQRLPLHRHLRIYAANRPHVDACRVVARAKEDFGSTIPEGHDLRQQLIGHKNKNEEKRVPRGYMFS